MKKKFKKIVNWSYKWNGADIIVFLIGLLFAMIPVFSNINITFDNFILSNLSISYYIIGGIIILISLIVFIGNFNRKVWYEEV